MPEQSMLPPTVEITRGGQTFRFVLNENGNYTTAPDLVVRPVVRDPMCGHRVIEGDECPCDGRDPEPTCDICGEPQDESPDWNGETGNHTSCEAFEDETNPVSSPTMACECYSCVGGDE